MRFCAPRCQWKLNHSASIFCSWLSTQFTDNRLSVTSQKQRWCPSIFSNTFSPDTMTMCDTEAKSSTKSTSRLRISVTRNGGHAFSQPDTVCTVTIPKFGRYMVKNNEKATTACKITVFAPFCAEQRPLWFFARWYSTKALTLIFIRWSVKRLHVAGDRVYPNAENKQFHMK